MTEASSCQEENRTLQEVGVKLFISELCSVINWRAGVCEHTRIGWFTRRPTQPVPAC